MRKSFIIFSPPYIVKKNKLCTFSQMFENCFKLILGWGTGLGIRSFDFRANRLFFVQKWANERFAKKNERFTHLLIFGDRPERFAHDCSFPLSELSESLMVAHFCWATWAICSHRSFLLSNLSDSLTLLTKKEGMSDSLIF